MSNSDQKPMFDKVALIGLGLIGSSLSHVMRRENLAGTIAGSARSERTLKRAGELGLADALHQDPAEAVKDADLVFLNVPVGAMGPVAERIAPALKQGAILTDVGSVKAAVIRDVSPHVPEGVHFIPGHPIAGTEQSGPDAGFAELLRTAGASSPRWRAPMKQHLTGCAPSGKLPVRTWTAWTRSIMIWCWASPRTCRI
jgi:cyclohexadieny/prephenate dehydrogenase